MRFEVPSNKAVTRAEDEYSLKKFRVAPEETLSLDDREFIQAYGETLDDVIARANEHPSLARGILREMLRPDAWSILLNMGKGSMLLNRVGGSKQGQLALAQNEAEKINDEYDRRSEAVKEALAHFSEFVEEVNGRRA